MRVAVIGAGGHGKVVADAIIADGSWELAGFLDDNRELSGAMVMGFPVLGAPPAWAALDVHGLAMGLGSNAARRRQFQMLREMGAEVVNAVHPRATIGAGVTMGRGVVMLAQAVVNADSVIGDNVILNTASTVDHDCLIGADVHLAPGVHLAGNVTVGEGAFLGIGAVVLPGVSIGAWATIGAGAVVIADVPAASTVIGVPARRL